MASPGSGKITFGPDWLFANLDGGGSPSTRSTPRKPSGRSPQITRSSSSATADEAASNGAASADGRRRVYTTPQVLAKFAEGMPVPESLLQFPRIVRTESIFPQAFTPLTESERAESAQPINPRGGGGARGGLRTMGDKPKNRLGSWSDRDRDGDGGGDWTQVDNGKGANGGLRNKVEIGPDGQRRLVISGLGNRGGRFGSADNDQNWRRGPPRPPEGVGEHQDRGDRGFGRGYGEDRGGFGSGGGSGGRGHRGGHDEDDVPEWATEPVAKTGGSDLGGFGADGTFFSSAADMGALESLEPLEAANTANSTRAEGGILSVQQDDGSGDVDEEAGSRILASLLEGDDNGVVTQNGSRDDGGNESRPAWAQALISSQQNAPGSSSSASLATDEADEWYYKDLADQIQGPFTTVEMSEWYDLNYFELTLLIRRGATGNFVQLGQIVGLSSQHRAAPFRTPVPGFNSPGTPAGVHGGGGGDPAVDPREQAVREQQEHAMKERAERHWKEQEAEKKRLEQERLAELQRAEEQRRAKQQRLEQQQRAEAERRAQAEQDVQRSELERQRREAEERQQVAADEDLRQRQQHAMAVEQQQVAMLGPEFRAAWMQLKAQFQQQQMQLQHQLMEVNQRMQEIYQARKQVQEALQAGKLVIKSEEHAHIQQQEVVYNEYHMKRLEIYEHNKHLNQQFAVRQQQILRANAEASTMAGGGGNSIVHSNESQMTPAVVVQAPPSTSNAIAAAESQGAAMEPAKPLDLTSVAEGEPVPAAATAESSSTKSGVEPLSAESVAASTSVAPSQLKEECKVPSSSHSAESMPGSPAWQAAQATETSDKASLADILKEEEAQKEREKAKVAAQAEGTARGKEQAAPSNISPWGAVPNSSVKSIEAIQAEEAAAVAKAGKETQKKIDSSKPQTDNGRAAAAPISFLEIQRAEEEAKRVLQEQRRAAGVEPNASPWSAAVAKGSHRPSGFVAPATLSGQASAWGQRGSTAAAVKVVASKPSNASRNTASAAKSTGPDSATSATPKGVAPGDDTFWDYESTSKSSGSSVSSAARDTSEKEGLSHWCEAELKKLDSSLDAETFAEFLQALPDEEVEVYVLEHYSGDSGKRRKRAREFVQNFLDRRARAAGTVSTTSGWHTAGTTKQRGGADAHATNGNSNNSGESEWGQAGKGKNRRKRRGQKVDPSLLS